MIIIVAGQATSNGEEAKNSLLHKANENFIKKLKSEGYTFIDLGHGGYAPETSAFYDLELDEIFN